jgi:hypothetical protein
MWIGGSFILIVLKKYVSINMLTFLFLLLEHLKKCVCICTRLMGFCSLYNDNKENLIFGFRFSVQKSFITINK